MDQNSRYEQLLNWLFEQFPAFQKIGEKAYKPTLENTLKLIAYFEIDLSTARFVHVAGTNGKGTTCSIIASFMKEAGYKTGLFTSPHLNDFRERIRINGEMIPKQQVLNFIQRVQEVEWDFKPSFFEITWVLALQYFIESHCDIIVVETGLGGRLDATNVIRPEVSVITNIGLDHTAILGDTRTLIASEKAGIIKPGVPVLIGENDEEIRDVFITRSNEQHASLTFINLREEKEVFLKNKRLAYSVLLKLRELGWTIDEDSFERGIENLSKNTGLKGRFQYLSETPLIIADAAHNAEGILLLIQSILQNFSDKNILVLYGASNEKDLDKIFVNFPKDWQYFLTEFKNKRSCSSETLEITARKFNLNFRIFQSSGEAFSIAQNTMNEEDVLVVFGSFFLLEEII
ncbi:MAG: Mur ligase family protein [Brumimicrobium sp.]|nr:Mur ligase family protein [Brumimicrobium sp.]